MSFKTNVTIDHGGIKKRIEADCKKATFIIANELLKDANYYARHDSGVMIASSVKGSTLPKPSTQGWSNEDHDIYNSAEGSKPNEGALVWDTPYAKKAYYVGTPSKDKNPDASLQWADKAAKENREKYLDMARKIARGIT